MSALSYGTSTDRLFNKNEPVLGNGYFMACFKTLKNQKQ